MSELGFKDLSPAEESGGSITESRPSPMLPMNVVAEFARGEKNLGDGAITAGQTELKQREAGETVRSWK